jgi:murein DD-endopeptidase MepM/ murein hydrolase activator NlpD
VAREKAVVTAEFGIPRGGSRHEGIDLAAPAGTPVWATADGTVVDTGRGGRFGKTVVIDHGAGYRTRYAHLKKIDTEKGKRVKRGDVIGRVGKSGNASGPHLHYEVLKNGVPVNPRGYLD